MTAPDLSAIRAQHAAVAGPEWVVNDEEQTVRVLHPDGGEWCGEIIFDRSGFGRTEWAEEKPLAAFIAAAPSTVERLLGIVDAVEALADAETDLAAAHHRNASRYNDGSAGRLRFSCLAEEAETRAHQLRAAITAEGGA